MKSAILEPDLKNQPKSQLRERAALYQMVSRNRNRRCAARRRQNRLVRRNVSRAHAERRESARWICHHGCRLTVIFCAKRDSIARLTICLANSTQKIWTRCAIVVATVREAILSAPFPGDLESEILAAYDQLQQTSDATGGVAVRSSATAEDLPEASFAGQQETYLNVRGHHALIDACRRCFASLFTDRAISYRADQGFDHRKIALSIAVQRMVRSDLGAAGVMFTIDTETGFRDAVLINAAYGLGENVVQGSVNPDEYYVFKPTLKNGFRPILQKTVGSKEFKLVYDVGGAKMVKNVPVSPGDRNRFAISDDDILTLARWACVIEEHYSKVKGKPTPMDIEWAKDGRTGELFILQARPETVESRRERDVLETYQLKERGRVLASGRSIGSKIATGRSTRDCRMRTTSMNFSRVKSLSLTRPIPIGSRS